MLFNFDRFITIYELSNHKIIFSATIFYPLRWIWKSNFFVKRLHQIMVSVLFVKKGLRYLKRAPSKIVLKFLPEGQHTKLLKNRWLFSLRNSNLIFFIGKNKISDCKNCLMFEIIWDVGGQKTRHHRSKLGTDQFWRKAPLHHFKVQ